MQELQKDVSRQLLSRLRTDTKYATLHYSQRLPEHIKRIFNIDNGFSRNLLEFLYRPGYMIRDYIDGKRVHYFKPFQSLFVLAALYIMFVQLIDPEALKTEIKNTKKLPHTNN